MNVILIQGKRKNHQTKNFVFSIIRLARFAFGEYDEYRKSLQGSSNLMTDQREDWFNKVFTKPNAQGHLAQISIHNQCLN